jgi:hypothetical protein
LPIDIFLFLAADDERLARFIGATGVDPTHLREEMTKPSFQRGVLDYLVSDEALFTTFADATQRRPDQLAALIGRIRHRHFDRSGKEPL